MQTLQLRDKIWENNAEKRDANARCAVVKLFLQLNRLCIMHKKCKLFCKIGINSEVLPERGNCFIFSQYFAVVNAVRKERATAVRASDLRRTERPSGRSETRKRKPHFPPNTEAEVHEQYYRTGQRHEQRDGVFHGFHYARPKKRFDAKKEVAFERKRKGAVKAFFTAPQ